MRLMRAGAQERERKVDEGRGMGPYIDRDSSLDSDILKAHGRLYSSSIGSRPDFRVGR